MHASRSPGGHRREGQWRNAPRAVRFQGEGAEEVSLLRQDDFRRRRLTLSSVLEADLARVAAMADELDAGDW